MFSCLVSHASSNLGHVLSLSLPFMTMALLENASQSFCRMSLNMGLCDWMEVTHFWQKYHRSDSLPFRIVSGGAWRQLIIGDVSFDHLIQGASANTLLLSIHLSTSFSISI